MTKQILGCILLFAGLGCAEMKEEEMMVTEDCQSNPISLEVIATTDSPCGENIGKIEVVGSGGEGILNYKINGFDFQTSTIFNDLEPGKYQITAQDENGCEETTNATLVSGVSYTNDIESIIQGSCAVSGCHVTGEQAPDFTLKDNILSAPARILTQVNAGTMPPPFSSQAPLTDLEEQLIKCWVNEGAPDN